MKTLAQLNARSKVLAKSSATLAANIHSHMVDITEHFKNHGDASAASTLYSVLHSAVRRKAIVDWFEAYAGMKFVSESKDKAGKVKPAHFIRNKEIQFDQIDLDAAADVSPWEFSPEPAFKPFDLTAAIKAAIKKAEKALDDTEHADKHKVNTAELDALRALVA